MKESKLFIAVVVTLAALSFFSAAFAAENEALKIVPADSLFCVQVNNFEYSLSRMDGFLAGLAQSPMPLQMAARMFLAQLFGGPQLEGVNMKGSFVLFAAGYDNQDPNKMLTFVVPITDFKQFISANPNLAEADANGIVTIKNNGGVLTQAGNCVMIKSPLCYDQIAAMKKTSEAADFKSLLSVLDVQHAQQASSSPAWAYVNVPQLNKTFGPQIAAGLEEMKKQLSRKPPEGMPMMINPDDIVGMYSEIINTIMTQTKFVSLSLVPQPEVLNISTTVSSQAGTDMAKLFATQPSIAGNDLNGYLKDGAFMNIYGKGLGKPNSDATEFFLKIFGKKISPESAAKFQSLADDCANVFSGNLAASYIIDPNGRPPFAAKIVAQIKDKEKVKAYVDKMADLFNSGAMNDLYKSFGMPMQASLNLKRGVETYKDIPIDSATFVFKLPDSNSQEAMIIKSIYGEGIESRFAVVNDLWLWDYGGNADASVKELIDQAKSGTVSAGSSEFKAAKAILPDSDKADVVVTFNIIRTFGIMQAAMMPSPFAGMSFPSNSNIAIAAKMDSGNLNIDVAVPKAHIMELIKMFKPIIQQPTTTTVPSETEKNN